MTIPILPIPWCTPYPSPSFLSITTLLVHKQLAVPRKLTSRSWDWLDDEGLAVCYFGFVTRGWRWHGKPWKSGGKLGGLWKWYICWVWQILASSANHWDTGQPRRSKRWRSVYLLSSIAPLPSDTVEMCFFAVQSPWCWVSSYCTKWPIQRGFDT